MKIHKHDSRTNSYTSNSLSPQFTQNSKILFNAVMPEKFNGFEETRDIGICFFIQRHPRIDIEPRVKGSSMTERK